MSQYVLHSQSSGKGKTIILLHGYLSSSQYFKIIRPYLERQYRVIALDLLGFGLSPKPRADYTYEDHVEAVRTTVEALHSREPFILLGHSMGALIALRYAATYPDDVSSLLLFNPPVFTDKTQMIASHKQTGRRYRLMLYSPKRHIYWLTLRLLPRNPSRRRTAINFTDIIRMSPSAREGSYKHILGGSRIFQDLRRVHMPVLLVNGRYDRKEYSENLSKREFTDNIDVVTVDTGHHTLVRSPKLAINLIKNFLESSP